MVSKSNIKNDIVAIRKQLTGLGSKEQEIKRLMESKTESDNIGSGLLEIVRLMMEDSRKTRLILEQMQRNLNELNDFGAGYEEEAVQQEQTVQPEQHQRKIMPLSAVDMKILQCIQIKEFVCADDIKKLMNYKGKNAASARLNRLCMLGILDKHQAGHKVFYRFDAGKATKNLLIVSPQQ